MSRRTKRGRPINGILLIDKPLDQTSNTTLQTVKRLYNAQKAGHTGSLDPLATGMLPICFGEATKFSHYLLDADKHYWVCGKLGVSTTTGDAEGEIVCERSVPRLTSEKIVSVLQTFMGETYQVPPMYSALKYKGKPLYEYAREGIEIEREPRRIRIDQLDLLSHSDDEIVCQVHCSKGTYIRTLIEDIGERLGCGAHVSGLRRTKVADLSSQQMVKMEELRSLAEQEQWEDLNNLLLPIEYTTRSLPKIELTTLMTTSILKGQAVHVSCPSQLGFVSLYDDHRQFIGVGEIQEGNRLVPKRLIVSNH